MALRNYSHHVSHILILYLYLITVRNEVAKVMFLQASVCPQWGVCLSAWWDTSPRADTPQEQTHLPGNRYIPPEQTSHQSRHTPRSRHPPGADTPQEQTPPWEQTPPPLEQTPPRSRHTPRSKHTPPRETATAADGTHPTGMHSCYILPLSNIFTGKFPHYSTDKQRIRSKRFE